MGGGRLTGAVGALGDGNGLVGVSGVGEGCVWCTLLQLDLRGRQDGAATALVEGDGRGADEGGYRGENEGECGLDHVGGLVVIAIGAVGCFPGGFKA